jgi:hypothetical protein
MAIIATPHNNEHLHGFFATLKIYGLSLSLKLLSQVLPPDGCPVSGRRAAKRGSALGKK